MQKITGDDSVNDPDGISETHSRITGDGRFNSKRFDVNTDVRKLFAGGMGIERQRNMSVPAMRREGSQRAFNRKRDASVISGTMKNILDHETPQDIQ